jgi:hypothetical protein
MDVVANDSQGVLSPVTLGAVAQQIWVNGFKYGQKRKLQPSFPINATAPTIYDRLMKTVDFWVACGRSFPNPLPLGQALRFLATHADQVPNLANLQFTESADGSSQVVWLKGCGIEEVQLVEKSGAYIAFGYKVIGGVWSLK